MSAGRLANGGQGLDLSAAARAAGLVRLCGAAPRGSRRHACRKLAVKDGQRCELHGGRSTGARTPEGLAKVRMAALVHGKRSHVAIRHKRLVRGVVRSLDLAWRALRDLPETPELCGILAGVICQAVVDLDSREEW